MRHFIYLLLIWVGTQTTLQAQINFQGCTAEFGTTTYTFFNTGTTNDGGTIRNTYETTPIDGAQACNGFGFGFCEFRIIWSIANARWEFQLTDGVSFFTIYFNTSASVPNPPDLSLGTWVEEVGTTGGACGGSGSASISTLSGDVQSTLGGSSAPEIDLSGNGVGIADGDVTPSTTDGTDFGNVLVSSTSAQVFRIDNSGTSDLNINTISITGTNASEFVITGITPPTVIAAGAFVDITVTFGPTATGLRTATLNINSDDTDETDYDIALQGTGFTLPEIAITEWLSHPSVDDATDEWVELYNYGSTPVDIQNWRLRDEDLDNSVITTSSYIIQPGDYIVLARNKASFENDWLNCPDSRVIQVPMILGNTADEIIIEDASGNVVWQIAYINDETIARATYYTENNFVPRIWGNKASPGVSRINNDPASGTLGYQKNNITPDPNQRTARNGDVGSPFDSNPNLAGITRGNVLDFDGVNDYVDMGNPPALNITNELTLTAWVYARDVSGNPKIITKFGDVVGDNAYSLEIRNGRFTLALHIGGTWRFLEGNTLINANQWYHVAASYDGNTMQLYVNGELNGTLSASGTIDVAASTFKLGGWAGGNHWNGQMEEVHVWNVARTAQEIRERTHLTETGCEPNLVAYYQFNEDAGATRIRNSVGGGLNGTLINMDPATDWVASGVNVGNDVNSISNAQTLTVPAGASTANFTNANVSLEFTAQSVSEDFTATYEVFTPNSIAGIVGVSITQEPMWTINKETTTSTQTYNATFTLPAPTFNTTGKVCNFQLYNRPMYSEGAWTQVSSEAASFTATTVTYNDLTVTGQFIIVEDPVDAPDLVRGRSLEFDGVNDQVIIGNVQDFDLDFNDPFTAEAWIKIPSTATTAGEILTKFDNGILVGYTFGYLANGEVNFTMTNFNTFEFFEVRSNAGVLDIRDDQWHHVAMSYSGSGDATGVDIYIDGVRNTQIVLAGSITTSIANTAPASLGASPGGSNFFEGEMEKFTLWGTQRSANEIREGMHLTFTGCESNLLAYYQMNESPGSVLLPDLARGNNATLSAMNVVTAWTNSTANLGNDAASTSNSQTLLVPAGATNQSFSNANLDIQFNSHSVPENFTVTYQAFTPNDIAGIAGTTVIQNPMWTVNKETGSSTQNIDLTFNFPSSPLTVTNPCGALLYNRPMNSDGPWTLIATGNNVSANSATFTNITTTGQFLVAEDNTVGADIVRGDVLDFDGTNEYVDMGNPAAFNLTNSISLETWVNARDVSGNPKIITKFGDVAGDNAYSFEIRNGHFTILLYIGGVWRDVEGTIPVIANQWYHVAATYDGNDIVLYVNGVVDGVLNQSGTVDVSASTFKLAGWSGGDHLNGQMDETRVWSTARTATEIREGMHLTSSGCEEGLLAYYQFNDGIGATTLVDKTSNAHDGVLTNMDPATDWVPSGVNVGNDVARTSNSQTLTIIPVSGTRQADFVNANAYLEVIDNTVLQDYTVTYQAFTPNSIGGAVGTNIVQNPMWTINKSDSTPTARLNITFRYPNAPFTYLDATKYRLYWRPMYADGDWFLIKNYALSVSAGEITFTNLYETGQFMVVQASEQLISDVRGEMYEFGGADDYVQLPTNIPVPGDWTAELWFKLNTISDFENILHTDFPNQNTGFRIELSNSFPNGNLYFSISDNNVFRPYTIVPLGGALPAPVGGVFTPEEWYHIAIVGDVTNNRVRAYINGMLVVDEPHTNWPSNWANTVLGKGFNNDANRDFNGSLDEVRFWSSARTQNEIRENMHLTLKGTEPDIVTYYQFNDDLAVGTNNGVIDAMGNNNASTVNMTSTQYIPSEVAVAGGVSERMTITGTGAMYFAVPKVGIDFNTNPNGEVVVSRLMTEKPHGWETITGDVDNEYFVVWNYGTNQLPVVDGMTYDELSFFQPNTLPSEIGLYKRGSRQYGPTWGTAIAPADNITTGIPGSATFLGVPAGAPLTTGFSQFVIAQTTPGSSLPIELLSFEAERQNHQEVRVYWSTGMEINNQGFEVQRLLDGETTFTTVGYVAAKGSPTGVTTYQLEDPNSFVGVSYYRLKQLDKDGSYSYSPIRAVEGMALPSGDGMSVFPNPTAGSLNVQILEPLAEQEVQVVLLDAQGKVVREQSIRMSSQRVIDLSHLINDLPKNLYFLQVQTMDGLKQWTKKVHLR